MFLKEFFIKKMRFKDRHEAGQGLAKRLYRFRNKKDVIVLGIPRGGVEVAFEISNELMIPLSIIVTKKIGHPSQPEFAIGAVSPGTYVVDKRYEDELGVDYISKTVKEIKGEIKRRYKFYTNGIVPILKNKIAIR